MGVDAPDNIQAACLQRDNDAVVACQLGADFGVVGQDVVDEWDGEHLAMGFQAAYWCSRAA